MRRARKPQVRVDYRLNAAQKVIARMFSPFSDHGPEPLAKNKVRPHECQVVRVARHLDPFTGAEMTVTTRR